MGRPEEALAADRRVVALRPDFAEAHNSLGTVLAELVRPDEAVASYARAIARAPTYARAHDNLGTALGDLGRPGEAAAACARAIELEPGEPDLEAGGDADALDRARYGSAPSAARYRARAVRWSTI